VLWRTVADKRRDDERPRAPDPPRPARVLPLEWQ